MKKFILFLLAVCTLTRCSSLRQVQTQVVKEVSHDTLYLNKVQYDSIYVQNDHSLEYHPSTLNSHPSTIVDTIFITDKSIEYKYRLLRDTVRIHQIDSIPVIREVEVVKTERFVPGIYKWSLAICITLIVLLILYVLWKIKF